ncbi:hypothetical protein QT381_09625 [Galbitalea sp. SE-J8]|uniref:hypothetical protein n=1 Tax=Galbitalea sp. SE-J8 TaxID=3054952 RepID=UPI00259CA17A|nr:hypothetical protein [Galbitalea sp. SE-J8]MDM4763265.1 hypothetical protein [Galbitalea sp. SE-J8]
MSAPERGARPVRLAAAAIAIPLLLGGCAGESAPEPTPPATSTVVVPVPTPTGPPGTQAPVEPTTTPTSPPPSSSPSSTSRPSTTPTHRATPRTTPSPRATPSHRPTPTRSSARPSAGSTYPWHHEIVSTTFWVGEVFDPDADDGTQVYSTYDSHWMTAYGGCDGVVVGGTCSTEKRTAAHDYFPTSMTPRQNPFYLDLPFDDLNDRAAHARRGAVIPWASRAPYSSMLRDGNASLMKNRWVELRKGSRTCFGQIEDAGPGEYDDAEYVFGTDDRRPLNARYGGAGMDVSPALNGCLGFADLDGDVDRVSWRFVDDADVPAGPWTRIVTTSPAS